MNKLAKVGIGMLGTRKAITVRYFLQKFLWRGHILSLSGQKTESFGRVNVFRKTKEFPEKCNFLACSLDG